MSKAFTLTIEESEHGLWFVTSSDAAPMSRLFIAEKSLEAALAKVPTCITDLISARSHSKD